MNYLEVSLFTLLVGFCLGMGFSLGSSFIWTVVTFVKGMRKKKED